VVPTTWSIVVWYVPQDGTRKVKRLIFTIDGLAITLLSLSLPFLRQEILGSIPLVYMPSRRVEIVHSYTGEHIQIPFFWLQEATLIGPSPKKGNRKLDMPKTEKSSTCFNSIILNLVVMNNNVLLLHQCSTTWMKDHAIILYKTYPHFRAWSETTRVSKNCPCFWL